MARKKRGNKDKVIDAGRAESPVITVDPEVLEEFDDAQKQAGAGPKLLERKLKEYTWTGPELSGGDIDADWDHADVGEECVAGENPTPDQSVVEDIGEAVGETQEDEKPLRTAAEKKDRDRNNVAPPRNRKM